MASKAVLCYLEQLTIFDSSGGFLNTEEIHINLHKIYPFKTSPFICSQAVRIHTLTASGFSLALVILCPGRYCCGWCCGSTAGLGLGESSQGIHFLHLCTRTHAHPHPLAWPASPCSPTADESFRLSALLIAPARRTPRRSLTLLSLIQLGHGLSRCHFPGILAAASCVTAAAGLCTQPRQPRCGRARKLNHHRYP